MFNSKKLVAVSVFVLVIVFALPSFGAEFKNRKISDQQFLDLCRRGDANSVIKALSSGMSANTMDKDGRSALMYAAAYGNAETVIVLLKAGADVSHYGGSALIHAAVHGHADSVNALIKAGADVLTKNASGTNALMMAARNGHIQAVNVLLKAGADINAKNNNGWTALMYAADGGHNETVNALLNVSADVNIQNNCDNSGEVRFGRRTAVMMAAKGGHTHIVNALIEAGAEDKLDNSGKTALILAAESGNPSTVSALMTAGSYVNQADSDGRTAIDYARKNPNLKDTPIFRLLEERSN